MDRGSKLWYDTAVSFSDALCLHISGIADCFSRKGRNMKKKLQGISLILFGLLLGLAEGDLNHFITRHVSAFPFALLGLMIGAAGLILVFQREKRS